MGVLKLSTVLLAVLSETVFDPLLQAKQRATDVQKTVDQNAGAARKAIDAQERGDSSP